MVGVGEFEQFDGRAVFDYERDADAFGWAVGRNQDFAASKFGGEISHFQCDVRNLPDEIPSLSLTACTFAAGNEPGCESLSLRGCLQAV